MKRILLPSSLAALTLTTAALALLPACASRPDPIDGFEPASKTRIATLAGSDLRLRKLVVDGRDIDAAAFPISLRFGDNGRITGRSAVNRYFGTFELGENGAITWPNAALGMTRMAGPEPAMTLENQFSKALTASTRLLTAPDAARFESKDGRQAVEFQR